MFAIWWCALAYAPQYPADWWVENALVLTFLVAAFVFRHHFTLSRSAWLLLVGFLALHELGAHYTYSEVPYDTWSLRISGRSLNGLFGWKRNHYDRLVHFGAGLMLLSPLHQFLRARFALSTLASCATAVNIIMSGSMLYELIEWGAANVFGGDLGAAYLGSQGDPWDAQKDMGLASLGAIISATIICLSRRTLPPSAKRQEALTRGLQGRH